MPKSDRLAFCLRASVFLLFGFAVAFTAPLHRDPNFGLTLVLSGFVALAFANIAVCFLTSGRVIQFAGFALADVFGILACVLVWNTSVPAYTIAIVWSLTNIFVWILAPGLAKHRATRGNAPTGAGNSGKRNDRALHLALLSALAVASFLIAHDPIVFLGVSGVFAVMTGVLEGIAAFDPHATESKAKYDDLGQRKGTVYSGVAEAEKTMNLGGA